MQVHFWDMDGTLVNGDVDVSWKKYLIDLGLAPENAMDKVDFFYEQYNRGELDQIGFSRFQQAEFVDRSYTEMALMAKEHFEKHIQMKLYKRAVELIRKQQAEGCLLVLLTATSAELAEPVAEYLGIKKVIGTNLEQIDGRYTGEFVGKYCGGEGKLSYVQPYLDEIGADMQDAFYYGDSLTDIPVFEAVGNPIVCNPGSELKTIAQSKDWTVIDFNLDVDANLNCKK